ncbi:hypothetical protein RZE82_07865 [Mollicutes bacterium LVI A0039]|nr:hypothetical protein RZE82_07865 [Mollicutes bacterium LVI A0039]
MFDLREDLLGFLNELQLNMIEGLCALLDSIEKLIFALTDFSFINDAYYEMLESYKSVGLQIIIALTIGYTLYAMLLKPTDMTGILKNIIFASVILSSFGALFNFITIDVGSNIANSFAPENEQFIFSQSILKYSVKDYSNPNNDYYFDFTGKTTHDVDVYKFLKNDVFDESGKIIAEKGDLQYPVLIFSGLVYGIVLLIGMLIVSILTTINIIEIFISGIVGIFAISFNIGAESKFLRNYFSILSLTLGKIIANIIMLTLYTSIVKTISSTLVLNISAGPGVAFLVQLIVNFAMIWVILVGSNVFKRTFGIDLGLSEVAAGNLQSAMIRGGITSIGNNVKKTISPKKRGDSKYSGSNEKTILHSKTLDLITRIIIVKNLVEMNKKQNHIIKIVKINIIGINKRHNQKRRIRMSNIIRKNKRHNHIKRIKEQSQIVRKKLQNNTRKRTIQIHLKNMKEKNQIDRIIQKNSVMMTATLIHLKR